MDFKYNFTVKDGNGTLIGRGSVVSFSVANRPRDSSEELLDYHNSFLPHLTVTGASMVVAPVDKEITSVQQCPMTELPK